MSLPDLYVFAISHYCEKARWGLDRLGVDYSLRFLAPGPHMGVAQGLGAKASSLPILAVGDEVVQGSSAILDWAEAHANQPTNRLAPDPTLEAECRALEQRLDEKAGVHARRLYYSEALVDHPETVLPIFIRDLPPDEQAAVEASWDGVRQLMIARMDLGPDQRDESLAIVERELDWLDGLLADGRSFLVGDRLSRADLTAASLLAPLALPEEHPTYGALEVPPLARADLGRWANRPILSWVRDIYREYR